MMKAGTAVSAEAARQMALGVRDLLGADVGVSITGFAGPHVPPGSELGKVFIAIAIARGVECHEFHFPDAREKVREGATLEALHLLLVAVERHAPVTAVR
jgi:PncC family amidohydrolase